MRWFKYLLLILILLLSIGCQDKKKGGIDKMHWDRDMCERCQMAISERKFAVQVVEPKSGKVYKFDDLGCTVLWFEENKIPWQKEAKIFITDAKSGKWIDARSAIYTDESITPMAFGFAAYTKETLPKGSHTLTYKEIAKKIPIIEKLNNQKVNGAK